MTWEGGMLNFTQHLSLAQSNKSGPKLLSFNFAKLSFLSNFKKVITVNKGEKQLETRVL